MRTADWSDGGMRQNRSSDSARAARSGAALTAALTAALAGVLAAGAALAVAEPVAALVGGRSAPLIAVGSTLIDLSPEWLKSFAIRTFGANDKTVLLGGMAVVATLLAAAIGLIARRDRRRGAAALLGFGLIGVIAALSGPDAGPADALPSVIGAAVGALVLAYLSRLARAAAPEPPESSPESTAPARPWPPEPPSFSAGRCAVPNRWRPPGAPCGPVCRARRAPPARCPQAPICASPG